MPTNQTAQPDLFWVIGTDTHVGKTTIAVALVRVLNRLGWPAVGFKPFGGTLLQELIDFGPAQLAASGCEIGGDDVERLTRASPLTPFSMLDVVGPMYLLSYPGYESGLVMRSGSRSLGNVQYRLNSRYRKLLARPDVMELLRQLGVPIETAPSVPISFFDFPTIHPAAQANAFARLVGLGPRAIVCEGASRWLPHWREVVVNHLLLVNGDSVWLLPNCNLAMPSSPRAMEFGDVDQRIRGHARSLQAPLPLAKPEAREAVAMELVEKLLLGSGLLSAPA